MELAVWLRSLGLVQYEAAFRENAIDFSVLPDVTDGHDDTAQISLPRSNSVAFGAKQT